MLFLYGLRNGPKSNLLKWKIYLYCTFIENISYSKIVKQIFACL